MLAQFLALTLISTYSWFGGQGYCTYDFAVHEAGDELTNIEIVLRPDYDPNDTASGSTELKDETISMDVMGGSAVTASNEAHVETDCNVKGFDIVSATAKSGGQEIDLIETDRIDIETAKPAPLKIQK
ncbi:hypothetical protein [Pararhizobium sp.]|uniref:hypothetical protein n=1 Tax=Pararhizobium sp. TaxID=1977563 RepID=UPI0027185441|nr:hypothetical protein [Pararhizobium sp.]MDO9417633.1 hypothetical protein [Pararhizobium sp.]